MALDPKSSCCPGLFSVVAIEITFFLCMRYLNSTSKVSFYLLDRNTSHQLPNHTSRAPVQSTGCFFRGRGKMEL
jgi:hypothetical protein